MCTMSLSLDTPMAKSESLYILAYKTFGSRLWLNIAADLRVLKTVLLDMPKSTVRGLSERSYLFSWPRKLNTSTHNEISLSRSQKSATPYHSEQVPSNTHLTHTNFHFKFLSRYSHQNAVIFQTRFISEIFCPCFALRIPATRLTDFILLT
jgi:hypothetical protein